MIKSHILTDMWRHTCRRTGRLRHCWGRGEQSRGCLAISSCQVIHRRDKSKLTKQRPRVMTRLLGLRVQRQLRQWCAETQLPAQPRITVCLRTGHEGVSSSCSQSVNASHVYSTGVRFEPWTDHQPFWGDSCQTVQAKQDTPNLSCDARYWQWR
jgi:hypothetical protein